MSGAGSTWKSGGIAIGNRVDPDGIPLPPTAPDVSGTVIVANGGVIESDINVFNDGVLAGDGTVVGSIWNSGGVIAPGLSPGVLTVDGNFTMDTGQLLIEIAGLGSGEFDRLIVSGFIAITGGDILLEFLPGFTPTGGSIIPFLTATGGVTIGDAVTFGFSGLPTSYEIELDRTSGSFVTRVTAVPEPPVVALLGIGLFALALGFEAGSRINETEDTVREDLVHLAEHKSSDRLVRVQVVGPDEQHLRSRGSDALAVSAGHVRYGQVARAALAGGFVQIVPLAEIPAFAYASDVGDPRGDLFSCRSFGHFSN